MATLSADDSGLASLQNVSLTVTENVNQTADADMEDLFDDNINVEHASERAAKDALATATSPETSRAGSEVNSNEQSTRVMERRRELEYEEPEEPADVVFETVNEVNQSLPNIPLPKSSDGKYWVIKTPNYVNVDTKPFHPDTYRGPEHDDDEGEAHNIREKSLSIKLKVDNTIRWRWSTDEYGDARKVSNSRIIRWSDGSMSLRLGKELFDVEQTVDISASVPRHSSQSSLPAKPVQEGLTYLVAQHRRAQLLQSAALITGQLSLRPYGMQSETHRMLVRAVGQKHNKVARLRLADDPAIDPEKQMALLAKENSKRSRKARSSANDDDDDPLGGVDTPRRRRSGSRKASRRQNYDYDSEDDNENEKSVSSKRKKEAEYDEDDGFVTSDDASDEEETAKSASKRKRYEGEFSDEDDVLAKAEAKLEARSRRSRANLDSVDEKEVNDTNDMDVESEDPESEEDDEVKIQRAGARKKRVDFGDDDEEEA